MLPTHTCGTSQSRATGRADDGLRPLSPTGILCVLPGQGWGFIPNPTQSVLEEDTGGEP